MGISKMWKSLLAPSRVTPADEHNTSQDSAEFLAVLARQHQDTSDSMQSVGTVGPQLKNRFLQFVPWSRRAKNNVATNKEDSNSVGKDADAVTKQAWLDPTPMTSDMIADSPVKIEKSDEAAVDRPTRERIDTPVDDSLMIRKCADVRAQEAFDLVRMAQEAREQANQQLGVLLLQQDLMEKLEREWADSIFANMEHGHQQQLRRVVGLPAQGGQ
eukprot:TRINITY_DN8581_c0_g1_i1.p1 TRINITY_DN8581_c0_g1~~TRINITY_DN8581_c0_g1_i1.p1  ORF type:complete len:215 (-),score=42.49 TRINITY_DN8581_c0_g1_i1:268-912(-)